MSGGPFQVKEADSDQYRLAFAGVNIAQGAGQSGYADGVFLTIEQVRESFTVTEGTDGSVTRCKTNTRLVKITLNLGQSASRNDTLTAIVTAGENGTNGSDIGSFVLQDLQGTTLVKCSKCWVMKRPKIDLDRSMKERTWEFNAVWDVFAVGSN